MRLGCPDPGWASRADLQPSMRPRRVRLGCAGQLGNDRFHIPPSMRPRRVRLGCQARQGGDRGNLVTFNEAEARAPRMPPYLQPLVSQGNLAVFSRDSFQRRSNPVPSYMPTCSPCQRALRFQHLKEIRAETGLFTSLNRSKTAGESGATMKPQALAHNSLSKAPHHHITVA